MPPIGFGNKLHNKRVKNGFLLDFNLVSSAWKAHSYDQQTTLRWYQGTFKVLYTHPQSLGITLESFHFPEAVQVFLNPTPIT